MFSKEEAKQRTTLFWTAFGRYMTRHTSARGGKYKWLNYRTGVKDIYFRLFADSKEARVSIELQHADPGIRELFYEQFWELETMIHNLSGTEWIWEPETFLPDGREISRIFVRKKNVNLYNQADWSETFRFFEAHLLPLDEIWSMCEDVFKDLAK